MGWLMPIEKALLPFFSRGLPSAMTPSYQPVPVRKWVRIKVIKLERIGIELSAIMVEPPWSSWDGDP